LNATQAELPNETLFQNKKQPPPQQRQQTTTIAKNLSNRVFQLTSGSYIPERECQINYLSTLVLQGIVSTLFN
jgi:hypothetical protein